MTVWRTQGFSSFPGAAWQPGFAPPQPPNGSPPNGSAQARPQDPNLENGAPPSSYAVVDVLDGERGAILRLAGLTALRGLFIMPGLWIVGRLSKVEMTPMQLLVLSFGGSTTISLGMIGYYAVRRATGS